MQWKRAVQIRAAVSLLQNNNHHEALATLCSICSHPSTHTIPTQAPPANLPASHTERTVQFYTQHTDLADDGHFQPQPPAQAQAHPTPQVIETSIRLRALEREAQGALDGTGPNSCNATHFQTPTRQRHFQEASGLSPAQRGLLGRLKQKGTAELELLMMVNANRLSADGWREASPTKPPPYA